MTKSSDRMFHHLLERYDTATQNPILRLAWWRHAELLLQQTESISMIWTLLELRSCCSVPNATVANATETTTTRPMSQPSPPPQLYRIPFAPLKRLILEKVLRQNNHLSTTTCHQEDDAELVEMGRWIVRYWKNGVLEAPDGTFWETLFHTIISIRKDPIQAKTLLQICIQNGLYPGSKVVQDVVGRLLFQQEEEDGDDDDKNHGTISTRPTNQPIALVEKQLSELLSFSPPLQIKQAESDNDISLSPMTTTHYYYTKDVFQTAFDHGHAGLVADRALQYLQRQQQQLHGPEVSVSHVVVPLTLQALFASGQLDEAIQVFWTFAVYHGRQNHSCCEEASIVVMKQLAQHVKHQPLVGIDRMERFVHDLEIAVGWNGALLAAMGILVDTYSKQGLLEPAIRTLDHVIQKIHSHENDDDDIMPPVEYSSAALRDMVTACLRVLAKTTATGSTTPAAERIFQQLVDDWKIKPGFDTTRWFLKSLLSDRREHHPVRNTQSTHERLLELDQSMPDCLDLASYETLINSWCRWGYPAHAEIWLKRILERDMAIRTDHFVQIMSSWIKLIDRNISRDEAVLRIDKLFDLLQDREQIPDVVPVRPTKAICDMCMEALALSRCSVAPESMQKMLMWTSNHNSIDVSTIMINHVLTSWHRSDRKDAVENIESLFRFLRRNHNRLLNTYSYNTIMSVYVKHDRIGKAVEIFDQFLKSPRRTKARPSFRSYVILIEGFVADDDPHKATDILRKLLAAYQTSNLIPSARKPYTGVFNALIECWLWNSPSDFTPNIIYVLRCMVQLSKLNDVFPDDLSFSMAWSSIQYCEEPSELGKLTLDMYNTSVEIGAINVSQLRRYIFHLSPVLEEYCPNLYKALRQQLENDNPTTIPTLPVEKEVIPTEETIDPDDDDLCLPFLDIEGLRE